VAVRLVPFTGKVPPTLLFFCCVVLVAVSSFTLLAQYRQIVATDELLRGVSDGTSSGEIALRENLRQASSTVRHSVNLSYVLFAVNSLFGIAALGAAVLLLRRTIKNLTDVDLSCRQLDQFLSLLVDGVVKQGIYRLDADGNIASWNEGAERLTGYAAQEVLGESHGILYTERERESGKPAHDLEAALRTGRYEAECERRARDGQTLWAASILRPLWSMDGALTGFAAAIADISARKKAEALVEIHTRELERSNRELSQFAYVASHDLQEPLRKITAFGDRLRIRSAAALDESGLQDLTRMQQAAQRMSGLIENLLSLSRVAARPRAFETTNLNIVVREVLMDLEDRIKEANARVEARGLPTIMADASQMRQLLQNLVSNSLKYRKANVAPLIRIHAELTAPGLWKVEVADNGIGFDEKYGKMIFRPFRRLSGNKGVEGNGIGLAICESIIARHGGTVFAKSKAGEGTTIVFSLQESAN
jgi:PAS domain S-box-containing protein